MRSVSLWLAPLLLAASPAFAQVQVENPWARATPPGAKIGAAYMTLRNTTSAGDKLVGASSPAAAKVEPHITVREGDITRMRPVPGYDLPPNGRFELKPAGAHLMLFGLKAPLKEGERVPLVLEFQHAGKVEVELEVRALGASGAMPGMHGPMH